MARRRHALNPAKIKSDLAALGAGASRPQARWWIDRRLTAAALAVLSAVMLSAIFPPQPFWPLAYVALAPWVLVAVWPGRRWALTWAWLSGVIFWAANLYWLWWITLLGYAALVLYMSFYWFVAAVVVRAAHGRRMPMFAVLPVVWVAAELAREYVASGFPWFFLGHSQYLQTHLIQIADATGVHGVSFFVAMVNGALADVLIWLAGRGGQWAGALRRRALAGAGVSLAAAALLLGYGLFRLSQSTTRPGPKVGVVQRAYPIALGKPPNDPQKVLDDYLAGAHGLAEAGLDLLVLPETMLPEGLNAEFMELDLSVVHGEELRSLAAQLVGQEAWQRGYPPEHIRDVLVAIRDGVGPDGRELKLQNLRAQARQIEGLLGRINCPMLAGAGTFHRNDRPINSRDQWVTRNSALWIDGGLADPPAYSKIHLVPFSEYVPFKTSWLWLHKALRSFVPPVMNQLDPGRDRRLFELARRGQRWRIAAPICYEGTIARVCRGLIADGGGKQADILVNLSNDGWFIWAWGRPRGSSEHHQHLAHYVFRAIENRVPVVRAVNTGISASIDSNGRMVAVLQRSVHGRTQQAMATGSLLLGGSPPSADKDVVTGPQVLVDSRTSVYSAVGDLFGMAVAAAAIAMAGWLMWKRISRKKGLSGD